METRIDLGHTSPCTISGSWLDVAVGYDHVVAVSQGTGAISCWPVGHPACTAAGFPSNNTDFVEVGAGYNYSLARQTSGEVGTDEQSVPKSSIADGACPRQHDE